VLYLRTEVTADWKKDRSLSVRIFDMFFWFIPRANPGYEDKLHLVKEWLIEFDDQNLPWREIGLDQLGKPVIAGPDKENHGFWLDTNMKYSDFQGTNIDEEEFEKSWTKSGAKVVT